MKINIIGKLILTTLIATSLYANDLTEEKVIDINTIPKLDETVKSSYGYFNFGGGLTLLPLPSIGMGYQWQKNHFGYDIGLDLSSLFIAGQLTGFGRLLYYPKPNLNSQVYLGLGASGKMIYTFNHPSIGPRAVSGNFIIGNRYLTKNKGKRFYQLEVSYPHFWFDEHNQSLSGDPEFTKVQATVTTELVFEN